MAERDPAGLVDYALGGEVEKPLPVRLDAIEALGSVEDASLVENAIIGLLRHPMASFRQAAVAAASCHMTEALVEEITKVAEVDGSLWVREDARAVLNTERKNIR
jgi:hypothetical protein